jgi:amphi-Trp domain-containing protein
MGEKRDRDVEKIYSTSEFVAKLRRLADSLEAGERFEIQVAGERVYVPARAEFNVEHEREGDEEGSTEEYPLDSRGHIRGEVLAVKGARVGP